MITPEATVSVMDDPDDPDISYRVIEFTGLPVADYAEHGRVRFSMLFEKEIQLTHVVSGDLVVSFKGALSGVSNVRLFHPLGEYREPDAEDLAKDATVRTDVEASFRLCLDGIRYQDQRMVPDHGIEADRDRQESVVVESVVPDHATVIDLTNELSRRGYYVKRVIENPPGGGASTDVINRIWDIAGRSYDRVYPVDFHLVLTGEEFHESAFRARGGNTRVEITAQGAFTRPAGWTAGDPATGLEETIVATWDRLRDATVTTLERRALRAASTPHYRTASHDGQPVTDEAPAQRRRPSGDESGRAARLRKQLDEATAAVISGDIAESTYRSIQAVIRRELDEMDEE